MPVTLPRRPLTRNHCLSIPQHLFLIITCCRYPNHGYLSPLHNSLYWPRLSFQHSHVYDFRSAMLADEHQLNTTLPIIIITIWRQVYVSFTTLCLNNISKSVEASGIIVVVWLTVRTCNKGGSQRQTIVKRNRGWGDLWTRSYIGLVGEEDTPGKKKKAGD